jgi:hypothetical protein
MHKCSYCSAPAFFAFGDPARITAEIHIHHDPHLDGHRHAIASVNTGSFSPHKSRAGLMSAPNSGARADIPVTFGNERGLAWASAALSPMRIAVGLDGMRQKNAGANQTHDGHY